MSLDVDSAWNILKEIYNETYKDGNQILDKDKNHKKSKSKKDE